MAMILCIISYVKNAGNEVYYDAGDEDTTEVLQEMVDVLTLCHNSFRSELSNHFGGTSSTGSASGTDGSTMNAPQLQKGDSSKVQGLYDVTEGTWWNYEFTYQYIHGNWASGTRQQALDNKVTVEGNGNYAVVDQNGTKMYMAAFGSYWGKVGDIMYFLIIILTIRRSALILCRCVKSEKGDNQMLKQEFSDRTGFYPSADMYAIIENKYLEMDVGKDRFCKMYKNNDEGLAEYIQSAADKETVTMLDEMTKKVKEEKEALQCRIRILESGMKDLQFLYDKELEWKPYENQKLYIQEEYDKLAGDVHEMDVNVAKKFIADSFGFNPDRILILNEYPKQEINRHGKIRNVKGEFYERKPLYESTDYNYILFSCAGIDYECVDGELYMLTD